ncbi:MAG TPA: ATP-dependent helicase [Clostridia bacterium]|nr:ATP-dependent helicase [Clostridia bacterium]
MEIFNLLKEDYSIQLNTNQKKALIHKDGPALTLAIPGSGKTTLLLCRIFYLDQIHKIPYENILTLTFSKASATDLKKRYEALFGKHPLKLKFSTIHKFSYKIVRQYYKYRKVDFQLIEGKYAYKKINLLKGIYKQINQKHISNEDLENLINDISYTSNMMLKENFPKNIKKFEEIYNAYKTEKKKNKMIDFDDMLIIALRVLEKHENILEFYTSKYKYIQLDEAQDTSIVQHKLIKLLSKNHNNVFMVADDDQSIYGFRGAYPKYLLDFKSHYKSGKLFYLQHNYRSSFEIIDACQEFINHNKNRYNKKIVNKNSKSKPIKIIEFSNNIERNQFLLNSIVADERTETAILYRNNISGLPLINLLEKENIPFNIRGKNTNLFNHWLIDDIKAFFNVILINQDIESFERIYYKLNSYISKNMINYLKLNARGQSVFDCLIQNPSLKRYQSDTFRSLKEIFLKAKEQTPIEIINTIKYELNYLNHLDEYAARSNNHYENLKEKLQILEAIASKEASAFEFLDRLNHLETIVKSHKNNIENNIILSTMHSAKGLEFERVFIIDVKDSILPQSEQSLEEDRRLLYVALSRAKSDLNILHAKFISGKYNNKIQFIDELKKNNHVKYKIYKAKEKFTLEKGEIVHHKKFGVGKILDITNRNVSIAFDQSLKVLSKDLCIRKNLLTKTKEESH